jgi:prenyltransferase beta subunit
MRGGFSKGIGGSPDPLHTYMSLCGLSLGEDKGRRTKTRTVKQICPLLGFSIAASARAPPLPRSPWEEVAAQ